MQSTPIFWTDTQQANERLAACVILYDGLPFYVTEAFNGDDGKARVNMTSCGPNPTNTRKLMDSPKFKRFRELPQIGWMNPSKGASAVFLERHARRSRQHGLSDQNVTRKSFRQGVLSNPEERRPLTTAMTDEGFVQCVTGVFPSLAKILANIEENSALAYSRKYCVYRDSDGIRWLYREAERVGLFTGTETLNLLSKFAYCREEIMADPAFTLDRIQEF